MATGRRDEGAPQQPPKRALRQAAAGRVVTMFDLPNGSQVELGPLTAAAYLDFDVEFDTTVDEFFADVREKLADAMEKAKGLAGDSPEDQRRAGSLLTLRGGFITKMMRLAFFVLAAREPKLHWREVAEMYVWDELLVTEAGEEMPRVLQILVAAKLWDAGDTEEQADEDPLPNGDESDTQSPDDEEKPES